MELDTALFNETIHLRMYKQHKEYWENKLTSGKYTYDDLTILIDQTEEFLYRGRLFPEVQYMEEQTKVTPLIAALISSNHKHGYLDLFPEILNKYYDIFRLAIFELDFDIDLPMSVLKKFYKTIIWGHQRQIYKYYEVKKYDISYYKNLFSNYQNEFFLHNDPSGCEDYNLLYAINIGVDFSLNFLKSLFVEESFIYRENNDLISLIRNYIVFGEIDVMLLDLITEGHFRSKFNFSNIERILKKIKLSDELSTFILLM